MPGIDLLISRALSTELKKNLNQNTLKKLERELFFEYGMSTKLSIEHFEKFHEVLKNNLDGDIEKFEKDCLGKVIQISESSGNHHLKIISKQLSDKIFDFFGDPETRKILQSLMGKSLTVSELLEKSGILKSPAYRKIENLLLDGLILQSGKFLINSKRVSKFTCVFDKVRVTIAKDELVLEAVVNSSNFRKSSISQINLF